MFGEGGALAATILAFLAINALLFATPLYRSVVAPDSSAGIFERSLAHVSAAAGDARRDVLVLGDSRIYNGFDGATAQRSAPQLRFINAGVPGTTPRCWTVFVRALDPTARRFRAVVVPVDTYSDDDGAIGALDANEHYFDLHYIVFETAPNDIVRVTRSFAGVDRRYQAFFDLALRGPLLREDAQNFIVDPGARFAALAAERRGVEPPHLRDGDLSSLRVDFAHDALVEPPEFPASQLAELHRQVLAVAQPSLAYAAYRREWLGAIVRRYRATGTPVIFVRIPTRPVHRTLPGPPSGTIASFAARDGAALIAQAPYVALERPELFVDADHLNRTGALRFSRMLADDVARVLRTAPGASGTAPQPPHTTADRPARPAYAGFPSPRAIGIGSPMRFQSFEFAVFFVGIVAAYYALRDARPRRLLLLAASWYFYARWNAAYLGVLLALTTTDFFFALGIERMRGVPRRALLASGITANAAFLGTVKYSDFLSETVARHLGYAQDPWALRLLVPVGISFHTFQSISYLVDVARGKVRAERNFLNYALYIAFFPQLLAGPIVRAATFFGELYGRATAVPERFSRGLLQIVLGLVKKSVLADRFAPAADAYFGAIAVHPGALAAWSGTLAFGLQIYFDFSGYSDIAIGCARVLGFDFPENFRRPYLAWSVTEFWRRWHMTLSAWLRDYLYIPFGGNRHGRIATYRNLMLTMLIGGLWHGAGWTFVLWGAYHGAALAVERACGIGRSRDDAPPHGAARMLRTLSTFAIVLVGWVFFRAQTFPDAFAVLRSLAGGGGTSLLDAPTLALAGIAIAVEVLAESGAAAAWRRSLGLRAAATTALLVLLELGSYPGTAAEFVYFKF